MKRLPLQTGSPGREKTGNTYRLPSEEEWQAAAAGKEGREYPWGNTWNENWCNSSDIIQKPSSVGVFEKGDTPAGDAVLSSQVSDLAGNVWEWTGSGYFEKKVLDDAVFFVKAQDLYEKGEFLESLDVYQNKNVSVVRGGSWCLAPVNCRCASRYGDHPIDGDVATGFRCARI